MHTDCCICPDQVDEAKAAPEPAPLPVATGDAYPVRAKAE